MEKTDEKFQKFVENNKISWNCYIALFLVTLKLLSLQHLSLLQKGNVNNEWMCWLYFLFSFEITSLFRDNAGCLGSLTKRALAGGVETPGFRQNATEMEKYECKVAWFSYLITDLSYFHIYLQTLTQCHLVSITISLNVVLISPYA